VVTNVLYNLSRLALGLPSLTDTIVERMRAQVSGTPALTVVVPVIGCHSGPGAIGVGFYKPVA